VADAHFVQHATSSGAFSTHATLAPHRLTSMDSLLSEAANSRTYSAAILREALLAAQPFAERTPRTASSEPGDAIIHILGPERPNRDGTMYAEGLNRFHFRCDNFLGKPAQIPAKVVRQFGTFLRGIGRSVVLRDAKGNTLAASEDGSLVFGWRHKAIASPEGRWVPLSWDRLVLLVPREKFLQELAYIRRELPQRRDSARIIFDATPLTLRFEVGAEGSSRSSPISVQLAGAEAMPVAASFAHEVNVDNLIDLFNDVRTTVVEFRMCPFEEHNGPAGMAGLRTVDEFLLDHDGKVVGGRAAISDPASGVHTCKVTRLMSSKAPS